MKKHLSTKTKTNLYDSNLIKNKLKSFNGGHEYD